MSRPLWMGLHFPGLPLAVIERAGDQHLALNTPLAVTEKDRIYHLNLPASAAGLRTGQRPSAALAQLPELVLKARQPEREAQNLRQLAAWVYQFSDHVRLWPPHSLVLEAGGSLKLFGDLQDLERALGDGLARLGYRVRMATSPSARSAQLLARQCAQDEPVRALDRQILWQALKPLPLNRCGLEKKPVQDLESSGIHTLGALLKLPRASLQRRFGKDLLEWLDELVGRQPDQQPRYQPPRNFHSQLELPDHVNDTEGLRFPMHRLIQELCGCLRGLDCNTQRIEFQLDHHTHTRPGRSTPEPTRISLGLASPSQQPERWLAVLRERLSQWRPDEAVSTLHLRADELQPVSGDIGDLFQGADQRQDRLQLLERLRQRVQVQQLDTHADHRPEKSWLQQPVSDARKSRPAATEMKQIQPRRPLWLLPEPRPLPALNGELALQGPERIETGWWDQHGCRRDYYVARLEDGRQLWVFHEPDEACWYLHGYFF